MSSASSRGQQVRVGHQTLPGQLERGAQLAMYHADTAVVVTNPEISSVRDSDRIIGLLDSKTERAERGERVDKHLLLTRYDPVRAARGDMLKTEDVLEILSIPLLGIIPESQDVLKASNLGSPVTLADPTSAQFAEDLFQGSGAYLLIPSRGQFAFAGLT